MHKVRVLIVSPPALSRLIRQLFEGDPEFEVVGSVAGLRKLPQEAERLLPAIIVATIKPVSAGVCETVLAIKRASPGSRLLLICPVSDLVSSAIRCGADACVREEELVGRLLPAATTLSEFPAQM